VPAAGVAVFQGCGVFVFPGQRGSVTAYGVGSPSRLHVERREAKECTGTAGTARCCVQARRSPLPEMSLCLVEGRCLIGGL